MTSYYKQNMYRASARKRQFKWEERILDVLEQKGESLTVSQLRSRRKLRSLEASDRWFKARLQKLEKEGLVAWEYDEEMRPCWYLK